MDELQLQSLSTNQGNENFGQYFDTSPSTDSRPTATRDEVSHIVYLMNRDRAMRGLGEEYGSGYNRPFKETHAFWLYFHEIRYCFGSNGTAAYL